MMPVPQPPRPPYRHDKNGEWKHVRNPKRSFKSALRRHGLERLEPEPGRRAISQR